MTRRSLVEGIDLVKTFTRGGPLARRRVTAVDNVTIRISRGESLALVGESGSGKSTLGRLLLRLLEPDHGRIIFDGKDITREPEKRLRPLRRRMQLIPQDPYTSFNPLLTVGEQLAQPLLAHGIAETPSQAQRIVIEALEQAGLAPGEDYYHRRPSQLSGGQLQRAAIVRALLLQPDFIVADEPTSSLDVSVRAAILKLIKDYQEKHRAALLFITHDLATAKLVADRIAVMYLGRIMEEGPAAQVLRDPHHPYTAALLTAIPRISKRKPPKPVELQGDPPDPANPPKGCPLHPRCPLADRLCKTQPPTPRETTPGRLVACHHPLT